MPIRSTPRVLALPTAPYGAATLVAGPTKANPVVPSRCVLPICNPFLRVEVARRTTSTLNSVGAFGGLVTNGCRGRGFGFMGSDHGDQMSLNGTAVASDGHELVEGRHRSHCRDGRVGRLDPEERPSK